MRRTAEFVALPRVAGSGFLNPSGCGGDAAAVEGVIKSEE
jgi:hypothetical protein